MTSTSQDSRAPCPPSTSDFLEFHAIQSPSKVAIDWNHQTHTYAQMHRDLVRVTHGLYKLGLRPGQLALVHQLNPYFHILLLLACEELRVATASLPTLRGTVLFDKADVLLSGSQAPVAPLPAHIIDEPWFSQVLAIPTHKNLSKLVPPKELTDILRITRSSGTTGQPKMIRLNRTQLEYSVQGQISDKKLKKESVFLIAYGLDIMSIWGQICACLRLGATLVWGELFSLATQYRLTHLWLLPVDLSNMLKNSPMEIRQFSEMTIFTAGAPVAQTMRAKARALWGVDVVNWYGANEVSAICRLDGTQCGILKPGLEVKIVDDAGAPVDVGIEGTLAFRSPGMIDTYWDQPDYTKKSFRDGWFSPGDRGKLLRPRVLQHLGRSDEMLNFGGIKQSPEQIEKVFLSLTNVLDAGATTMTRQDGVDVLLVAVVLSDVSDLPYIKREAQTRLLSLAKQMHIIVCQELPRTANGKLKRLAIRDLAKNLT
jgi:acyl-coenzyme A synthetase/AMP-(fatty) acid ligase